MLNSSYSYPLPALGNQEPAASTMVDQQQGKNLFLLLIFEPLRLTMQIC